MPTVIGSCPACEKATIATKTPSTCMHCGRWVQVRHDTIQHYPKRHTPIAPPPTEYAKMGGGGSSEPYLPISLVIMFAFLLGLAVGLALSVR